MIKVNMRLATNLSIISVVQDNKGQKQWYTNYFNNFQYKITNIASKVYGCAIQPIVNISYHCPSAMLSQHHFHSLSKYSVNKQLRSTQGVNIVVLIFLILGQ
jgi:hypothetical protein